MRIILAMLFAAALACGQTTVSGDRAMKGYTDMSAGSWRPPEVTFASLPSAGSVTGKVYLVTDSAGAGNCSAGGGSSRTLCRSTGSGYEALGGGVGGGSASGTDGAIQYNSGGSFAGQSYVLGGTRFQRGVECSSGTVSYTALTASATSQEIAILSAVPAKFRYNHVLVQEAAQMTGTPSLTVSMGTTGVDTDLLLPLTLKNSSAQNYGYETPRPPAIGTGSYNLVLQFVGSAALGNGTTTNFTGGSIYWEVCGFSVQ